MEIIFYETGYHYEVIGAYISQLKDEKQIDLIVLSNDLVKYQLQLKYPEVEITYLDLNDQLDKNIGVKSIVIITNGDKKLAIRKFGSREVYYVVHNINLDFSPWIKFTLKNWKSPFHIILSSFRAIKFRTQVKKVKGLIFLSTNLKDYFESQFEYQFDKMEKLIWPSYTILKKTIIRSASKKEVLHFIIPGNINFNRRDYRPLFEAFEELKQMHVKFSFVGRMNPKLLNRIDSLRSSNLQITHYEDMIDYVDYLDLLLEADYCIIPFTEHKYLRGVTEKNGLSSYSASLMDVYSLGIQALIPEYVHIEKELEENFIRYRDAKDLKNKILFLCNENKANLSNKADFAEYFEAQIIKVKEQLLTA